jgi:hypothetical protein
MIESCHRVLPKKKRAVLVGTARNRQLQGFVPPD